MTAPGAIIPRAIELLRTVLEQRQRDPSLPKWLSGWSEYRLGVILEKQGDVEAAQAALGRANELAGDDAALQKATSEAFKRLGSVR